MVKGGDHASGVIGCNHSERRIRSSIKVYAGFNSRDFPVFLHPDLELHVLLVPSPPEHEHLFSAVDHLHRPSCLHRSDGRDQIQGSGRGFCTEPTANRRTDDAYLPQRNIQNPGDHVMHVMRSLGGGIEHKSRCIIFP